MKVEHEDKSVPHNPNNGWKGKVTPASIEKLEDDYEKIHDAYFAAVASGDPEQSALMARVYRIHCNSRK